MFSLSHALAGEAAPPPGDHEDPRRAAVLAVVLVAIMLGVFFGGVAHAQQSQTPDDAVASRFGAYAEVWEGETDTVDSTPELLIDDVTCDVDCIQRLRVFNWGTAPVCVYPLELGGDCTAASVDCDGDASDGAVSPIGPMGDMTYFAFGNMRHCIVGPAAGAAYAVNRHVVNVWGL